MSKKYKKVLINSNSFVGISPRSKSGCLACRKKKKKCDEVHPICGGCASKNTICEWKSDTSKKHKYAFDIEPMIEAQKEILKQRSLVVNKSDSNNRTNNSDHESFIKPKKIVKKASKNNSKIIPKSKSNPAAKIVKPAVTPHNTSILNKDGSVKESLIDVFSANNTSINSNFSDDSSTLNPKYLVKPSESNSFIDPTINTSDVDKAVDELLGNDNLMDGFISNVVQHLKSPDFNPTSNFLDLSINSTLLHVQNMMLNDTANNNAVNNNNDHNTIDEKLIRRSSIQPEKSIISLPLFSPFEQFVNLQNSPYPNENSTKDEEKVETENSTKVDDKDMIDKGVTKPTIGEVEKYDEFDGENKSHIVEEDDDDHEEEEIEELDKYPPMDESQLLENLYISDSDLINVFKLKKLHPYLRPAVHLLLSKNNALKIINPSSPIMNQLDSTGKLFLENYVTNLAMNQLDIGNSQFFLQFALSQASNDPAILYGLVAWGGMFLVGRSNEEANKYFNKSMKLGQKRIQLLKDSDSNSKFNNTERVNLLLLYCLLTCADISTGDVTRWFQMLLQCKDILSDYGGLKQFIHENKNSKVANWILSNIFNHDLLCTRTLDYGTVFSIYEYKDVFTSQKSQQNNDYGLDPFYGLSQNLYLLLGEVANNRKVAKNSLKFTLVDGLRKETDATHSKKTEDSWFQIFDSQILHCKPAPEMLSLLMQQDSEGKLLEYHMTWYELTQISMRIYIRISFRAIEFDDKEIQTLRSHGIKLFKILVGTKLQTLLGLSLLMLGMTSISEEQRIGFEEIYDGFLKNYQILNVRVCWEIIKQVWKDYDNRVSKNEKRYVDWSEIVKTMGWNCCFT